MGPGGGTIKKEQAQRLHKTKWDYFLNGIVKTGIGISVSWVSLLYWAVVMSLDLRPYKESHRLISFQVLFPKGTKYPIPVLTILMSQSFDFLHLGLILALNKYCVHYRLMQSRIVILESKCLQASIPAFSKPWYGPAPFSDSDTLLMASFPPKHYLVHPSNKDFL